MTESAKRTWKRFLLMLVLLTAGGAGTVLYMRARAEASTPQFMSGRVTQGTVASTVDATGTLQPVDIVEVGTQVSGTIETLRADFNSKVTRNQVVATLDRAIFQSQVDQAAATVARLVAEAEGAQVQVTDAQQKLARAKMLSEKLLIPQTDLDAAHVASESAAANLKSAQAQLGQAQASLNQSQATLSHTIIRAPVDGVVLSRNVEVGQTVAAGLQAPTLFVIARDLGTMELDASVDEADIGRVAPGQAARFTVDAYGEEEFTGTLRQVRLQPTVTQNVVSYTAVIAVPNPAQKLKPGMTATVRIEIARADNVLRVPAAALRFRPSQELLTAVNGESVERGGTPQEGAQADGNRSTRTGSTSRNGSLSTAAPVGGGTRDSGKTGNATSETVWLIENGRLHPVRLQTGLSDGTNVEVVAGDVQPGAQVVTGVAAVQTTTAGASASPLMPSMPRRPGTGRAQGTSSR